MPIISARGSMLGLSMNGSRAFDYAERNMARAPFAGQKRPSSTSRRATCAPVQILLGHTKIESTVRYLGVDIEDALAMAEGPADRARPRCSSA